MCAAHLNSDHVVPRCDASRSEKNGKDSAYERKVKRNEQKKTTQNHEEKWIKKKKLRDTNTLNVERVLSFFACLFQIDRKRWLLDVLVFADKIPNSFAGIARIFVAEQSKESTSYEIFSMLPFYRWHLTMAFSHLRISQDSKKPNPLNNNNNDKGKPKQSLELNELKWSWRWMLRRIDLFFSRYPKKKNTLSQCNNRNEHWMRSNIAKAGEKEENKCINIDRYGQCRQKSLIKISR